MRFPEFQGEWEWYKLEEIATVCKGSGISKDQISRTGKPCILYGELYTKYKSEIIDKVLSHTDINSDKLVKSKANDVIIPSSGETAIDIATARCVPYSDILLGGDLNIIRLKDDNGSFLSYQLNGVRKQDIAKVAQGISVVHLYGDSLKKLKVSTCIIEEQNKISSLLFLIDQRIEAQNKIIEDLKLLKNTIRNKIFNQIKASCFKFIQIKDLIGYEQPTNYIVDNTNYSINNSLVPVLTANKAFILGYTDEKHGVYDKGDCIIFDDFTMDLKYVDFPFKVKSSAIKILKPKAGVNLRYVFEYLCYLNLASSEHKRHYISEIEPMSMVIPEIDKQDILANLLSAMDNKLIVELLYQDLLLSQKQYMQNHLFV